jgi:hypothetical protein
MVNGISGVLEKYRDKIKGKKMKEIFSITA